MHHSIETTLHDHIIKATRHTHITCLISLDSSAMFDVTDHTILFERLSFWFGITDTHLSWTPGSNLFCSINLSMVV